MASVAKREWTYEGVKKSAYVVRYFDETGARRSKQFARFKDADTYRRKVEAEMENGTHVASSTAATVKSVCIGFLDHASNRMDKGQIGRSRYEIYKNAINRHIVPHLGGRKIKDMSWADLEDWTKKLPKLSTRTVESIVVVFKMVEDYAIKRGYMKKSVVREFRRDAGTAKVKPIKTFTAESAAALIRAASERPAGKVRRVHAVTECCVHIAAFCGLRYGEIMGLTLEHVDVDNRVIRVRHNLTAWDLLKGPKTESGKRDVPMPAHIGEMIRAWVKEFYVENERGLIFRSRNGGAVGQGNFKTHHWYPLLKAAGLWDEGGDQLHFHALRHFAASAMIEHGLPLPDVASLMGHSKFDMTLQVYAHPIIGGHRRHAAFERMTGSLLSAVQEAPVASLPPPPSATRALARA